MTGLKVSLRGVARVFDLSLGQVLWTRRTLLMAALVATPVLVALGLRALVTLDLVQLHAPHMAGRVPLTGSGIFGLMIWTLYLRFIVPVLAVAYGTSLIADEVEDKTITYLFTRPISRGAVLLGKYLAYLVATLAVVLPSVLIAYFLTVPILGGSIGESFPSLVVDLGLIAVGLAVYGAVFALVGAWFQRPLLAGLIFVFGWEPVATMLPGYVRHATVAHYLQGLVPHAMPRDSATSVIASVLEALQAPTSVGASLGALGVIWIVALAVAVRVVEGREYVLEQ